MPSVMSKFIAEKMGTRASKRRRQDGSLPTPPKQAVHLPGETIVEAALFLDRLDLDAVQFSSQRHRTIVRDNAHLIPLRDLARISFEHNSPEGRVRVWVQPMEQPTRPAAGIVQSIKLNGTWEEVLAAKDQFQNVVRYSVPRRLYLATPKLEWDHVRELFGDTPITIRVSNEVVVDERVKPDIIGIQKFVRHFDLVNSLKITASWFANPNRLSAKCNDAFLQWCTENSLTQLEIDEQGAVLSDDAILDYCFGPDGSDSEPRHLKARFQCSADFISWLLAANRKCSRNGPITMDVMARAVDAPNVAELAPYRVEATRRIGLSDVTTYLLPDDFDVKIVYFYRPEQQWAASNCHIEVFRPAQPSQ